MRERFNLSAWGLRHRTLVWYMMFVSLLMGSWSFLNLGREEDPSFAIKTMVIQARWPGATLPDTCNRSPTGWKRSSKKSTRWIT